MVEPGQDYNYPTSSGNVPAGIMGFTLQINGYHISLVLLLFVLALVCVWQMAKKGRRR